MKRTMAIVLTLSLLVLVGCSSRNAKTCDNCVDPNYGRQLQAIEDLHDKRIEYISNLAKVCEKSQEPGLCVAVVSNGLGNNQNNDMPQVPIRQTQRSFGQELALRSVDLLGRAIPVYGSIKVNQDNNDARVAITQSNNDLLGGIVSDSVSGLTTVGSVPSTQVTGDYIVGDGNTSGDGNVVGDGNGDGDRWGDNNVVGDGITVGDGNGDGDRFGDGGTVVGDNSVFGDGNGDGDRNGDGSNMGDSSIFGDENGDENGDDRDNVGDDRYNTGDRSDNGVDNSTGG